MHTPTPYRVRQSDSGRTWFVEGPPDETDGACMRREVVAQCFRRDDAEFVATACNGATDLARIAAQRDALLAALKGLIAGVERDSREKGISGYTGARLSDARAAVAKAEPD